MATRSPIFVHCVTATGNTGEQASRGEPNKSPKYPSIQFPCLQKFTWCPTGLTITSDEEDMSEMSGLWLCTTPF